MPRGDDPCTYSTKRSDGYMHACIEVMRIDIKSIIWGYHIHWRRRYDMNGILRTSEISCSCSSSSSSSSSSLLACHSFIPSLQNFSRMVNSPSPWPLVLGLVLVLAPARPQELHFTISSVSVIISPTPSIP